jgi:hypothetical protein
LTNFKNAIDERIRASDILDDRTRGRLTTACAWALKIAMIFEAACLCYDVSSMPLDPQIIPDSQKLLLGTEALQLAIDHVKACLKAASSLDQVANRKSIAEQAQILIAHLRTRFGANARNGAIILTRTQITDSYTHNAKRHSDSPVSYIYDQLISWLIRIGHAKLVAKEGKKETSAFRSTERILCVSIRRKTFQDYECDTQARPACRDCAGPVHRIRSHCMQRGTLAPITSWKRPPLGIPTRVCRLSPPLI